MTKIDVYVDGTWHEKLKQYGYAFVAVKNNKVLDTYYNKGNNPKYMESRNIAGEIVATLKAINYGIYNGYDAVEIFYDYQGIEAWATGRWAAKKRISEAYVYHIEKLSPQIKITFTKVKAHSGNNFNNQADKLAKRGADLK